MLKIKSSVIAGAVLLTCLLPGSASAYFTKAQSAVALNDNVFLYTVSYDFGLKKYDLEMPVVALPQSGATDDFAVGYKTVDSEGETAQVGKSIGIVLSDAKLVNGVYTVPKGTAASFTLVVLVQATDAELASYSAEQNLALQVTSLPFVMKGDGITVKAKLNPSELKYYKTPELDI